MRSQLVQAEFFAPAITMESLSTASRCVSKPMLLRHLLVDVPGVVDFDDDSDIDDQGLAILLRSCTETPRSLHVLTEEH